MVQRKSEKPKKQKLSKKTKEFYDNFAKRTDKRGNKK
jgi:hypothetical protein